jgi:PAS domain S-box-containing protein
MSNSEHSGAPREVMIAELIETLDSTYRRLAELAGTSVDAVLHPGSGASYLMPHVQSELRRLESAERRHSAERAAILNALPANVALLDRTGKIVEVNEAWRRFARDNGLVDSEYSVGRNYLEMCEGPCAQNEDGVGEAANGIRRVLAGEDKLFSMEYPCHSPQEQRWFMLTVSPVGRQGGSGAVVMHVDITDRYCAEASAREMGARLERLIDQASVGILVHRDFVPLLANRELATMFAYRDADEVERLEDCRQLFADEDIDRIQADHDVRLAGAGGASLYRITGKKKNGARMALEVRAFTIEWESDTAVCVMLTDITAQLATEEQLRQSLRLEAVGKLTGGVAHDFNNLLTVILGNAEALVDSLTADHRLRIMAEMTAKAAERAAELTSRLLSFSRRQPLDPKAVDVNRQLSNMDRLLRQTLGEHIEIELVRGGGLWRALVDPGQLENAVLNLCINARDAMPSGGRLTVETANIHLDQTYAALADEVTPGQYVMIAVSDNGAGMDKATLEQAFEPFFTTKDVGKGSGLGLSMVYGFIKQSCGHVRIYSELGRGTTVKLYLPRAAAGDSAGATEGSDPPPETGSDRILLAEDDPLVREHVAGQLASLGYAVVSVGSGPAAMALLQQGEMFDLLFTDIVMPGGMNGLQLAKAAQALRPGLRVLFSSGYAENALTHQERLEPGIHILAKPYRRQDLAKHIRIALGK